MGKNGNASDVIEYRRNLIARLLIRKPNVTRRELHDLVGKQVRNPDTGEPFSLGTIQNDVDVLKADWRQKAARDFEEWIAEEIAKLDELETVAWQGAALETVLKCLARRAKLLGLDKPARVDARNLNIDLSQCTNEQLERIANGEDPARVLATTGGGGAGAAETN